MVDRCEPAQDIARLYVLSLEPPSFADIALGSTWLDLYPEAVVSRETLDNWLQQRSASTSSQLDEIPIALR